MARPGVTAPIASATSLEQLDSLIRAAALTLSADDMPGSMASVRERAPDALQAWTAQSDVLSE